MRSILIIAAVLTGATPAAANSNLLEAIAGAGACGGSISCSVTQDVTPPNPVASTVAIASEGNTLADGSYADASAIVDFGHMHLYSDAYRASGSDAQASAQGRMIEYFDPGTPAGLINLNFAITGSHTDDDSVFGNYAYAYFNWVVYDTTTHAQLGSGAWTSTDAVPQMTLPASFILPTGDGYELNERFEANTYSSYGMVAVADYSKTLDTYIASATPGPDVIGESGHDYSPLAVGGVPEPATWAMMLVGCGIIGSGLRSGVRKRHFALA